MESVHPFFLLGVSLLLLLPVQRQLHRHLQGLLYLIVRRPSVALFLYSILFLPGVALHEASHWVTAKLLRVRTRAFSLLPQKQGEKVRFGYVETDPTDPIRAALIGLAPLFVGSAAMGFLALDFLGFRDVISVAGGSPLLGLQRGVEQLATTPDLLLWLYLVFTISNTMLPSAADRAAWFPALGLAAALSLGALALGFGDAAAAYAAPWIEAVASNLTAIFTITAALDLVLLIPVLLMEKLIGRILGAEIVY